MTKSELIQRLLHKNPHLNTREVETIVNTFLSEMSNALVSGDRVELRGFGSLSVKRRDPRVARNPRTGSVVRVGHKFRIAYKASKDLLGQLNGDEEAA